MLEMTLLILTLGLVFALVAVLLQQFTGRPMLTGLALAVLFSIPAGLEAYGHSPFVVMLFCGLFTGASMVWLWLLRRFGFLTNVIVWLVQGMLVAWPLTITGWFADAQWLCISFRSSWPRWALWVILVRTETAVHKIYRGNQRLPILHPAATSRPVTRGKNVSVL